jgi:hypothetical protein
MKQIDYAKNAVNTIMPAARTLREVASRMSTTAMILFLNRIGALRL